MSKKECVHCKKVKTHKTFENEPTCNQCRLRILVEREKVYDCPHDGTPMVKEILNDEIIIDRCPTCKGIWLDYGELEAIKAEAGEHHEDNTMAHNLFIGMIYR